MNPCNPQKQKATFSILFADDDADDQFFFREALLSIDSSVQFEVAKDSTELLSLLRHNMPSLIFLNLHLPGNGGLECLKEIRSDSRFQNTSVVMLSSIRNPVEEKTAYQLGADQIFVKPFSFTDLKSGLKDALSYYWNFSAKTNGQDKAAVSGMHPFSTL